MNVEDNVEKRPFIIFILILKLLIKSKSFGGLC